jgi:hypothetical protein
MRRIIGWVGILILASTAPGPSPAAVRRGLGGGRGLPALRPSARRARRLDERRSYPSPDGRYVARLTHGDGNTWRLAITGVGGRSPLVEVDDVQALVWIPGHRHRLVVASCGIYGTAQLGLWQGGSRWRSLHRVRDPGQECFTLYWVTRDGRSIVYGYDPAINRQHAGEEPLQHRRWLRLPR